jgi:ribonuclease HI
MDKKSLWIENHNIPFKSKINKALGTSIYESCYFSKDNLDLIDEINGLNGELEINLNGKELSDYVHKGDVYTIISDGGSFNNGYRDKDKPMFGSYATVILKNNEKIYEFTDAEEDITNNYSELFAGIFGLRYILEKDPNARESLVIMSSDSQYLMKGINEWLKGWIKRGWKNNEGKTIPNLELWKEMNGYLRGKDSFNNILTCWVKGHDDASKNIFYRYNSVCDYMCNCSINSILQENGLPTRKI